jgi:hypothetical protein
MLFRRHYSDLDHRHHPLLFSATMSTLSKDEYALINHQSET